MMTGLFAALAIVAAVPSGAATPIEGYGAIAPLAGDETRPDPKLRYRIVFSVTKGASEPKMVNPSLDRAARFWNLLAREGVQPHRGDIVIVISGPATDAALTSSAYAVRFGGLANPNLPLIEKFRAAGITVAVCAQALQGQAIPHASVAQGVRIDVSAITTLAMLQLQGWALISD